MEKSLKLIMKENLGGTFMAFLTTSIVLLPLYIAFPPAMILMIILPCMYLGISSAFDFFTRKSIPKAAYEATVTKIDNFKTVDEINPLVKHIFKYSPMSFGSQELRYNLAKDDLKVEVELELERLKKREELQKQQFIEENPESGEELTKTNMQHLWCFTDLNQKNKQELNKFTLEQVKNVVPGKKLALYKDSIFKFFKNPESAGKKSQQRIREFLEQDNARSPAVNSKT